MTRWGRWGLLLALGSLLVSVPVLVGDPAAAATDHYTGTLSVTEELDETHPPDPATSTPGFHDVQSYMASVHVDYPETNGSFGSPVVSSGTFSGQTTRTSSDACTAFTETYAYDSSRSVTVTNGQKPGMTVNFPVIVTHSGGCAPVAPTATRVPLACPSTSPVGVPIVYAFDRTLTPGGGVTGQVRNTCTGTLTSGPVPTVVNSTADRPLSGNASTCTTGQTVGGAAECTLRAALQLANAGGPTLVTFAVPSTTDPVIAPASPLPVATRAMTLDGTSQGSWVVLSGAAAGGGDGLELDGPGSTISGFVINGFASGAGLVLGGTGGGQVVTGNRIGTNVAGTAAVPNRIGIRLAAPAVRIGGTVSTSATACTGSCNLLSGNTDVQVTNGTPGGAAPAYLAVTIQGNWIGLSATGTSALPGIMAVDLGAQPSTTFRAGETVEIGGVAPAPGVAPGNRIVASDLGVFLIANTLTPGLDGDVTMAGNTVGLLADGATAAGHGSVGVRLDNPGLGLVDIGGATAGAMNVISGWQDGIQQRSTVITGNRIGTDVTGTIAVGNNRGVVGGTGGPVNGNLVSGNHIGLAGGSGMTIGHGNIIGLTADGEAALPNDIGVGSDEPGKILDFSIGRNRTGIAPCTTMPCNVISGNRVAGIRLDSPLVGPWLELAGTYVGTDLTGTRAIPNGVGIELRGQLVEVDIGGSTGVTTGSACAYPCNVIAGNTGPGIHLTSTSTFTPPGDEPHGSIAGNHLGLSATGQPLLNGGPQLLVDGSPSIPDKLLVGGPGRWGNVVANADQPAIQVGGTSAAYPLVGTQGNRYRLLGGQTPITRPAPSVNPPLLGGYATSGAGIVVSGSTHVASDPLLAPEQVELYASAVCDGPGTRDPVGIGPTTTLGGDFAMTVPAARLAGKPFITAVRTDQEGSTSAFSTCLAGPTVTTTTAAAAAGDHEVEVSSNQGWTPGDYALLETASGPVVRRVQALGSLVLAAPVGAAVAAGSPVVKVPAPAGDTRGPTVKLRKKLSKRVRAGQKLKVAFVCADPGGVGVASCPAALKLSTKKPGKHTVTVSAWDTNGNVSTLRLTYRVLRRR